MSSLLVAISMIIAASRVTAGNALERYHATSGGFISEMSFVNRE